MRDGEKKQSRKVVHLFQKRWVFPTVYIVCAAVILTAALWFQATNDKKKDPKKPSAPYSQQNDAAVPVTKSSEVVKMPAVNADQVAVKKKFYDDKATAQEQEAALVSYNNTYSPNTGIDIAAKDGKSFDVTAAISGTVTKADKDSLLGYVVTVDSGNGVTTSYQSLESAQVEVGDAVAQGDVLGKAGLSEINKEAGYHVHFEIRKDGTAVNPEKFFDKTIADIKAEQVTAPVKQEEKQPAKDEKQNTDSKQPEKDEKQQEGSDNSGKTSDDTGNNEQSGGLDNSNN